MFPCGAVHLSLQIILQMAKPTLHECVAIGGEAVEHLDALSYLLREVNKLSLRPVRVRHLIVDEAERLFEMGFAVLLLPHMDNLAAFNLFSTRQTQLLSAIIPSSARRCTTRWWWCGSTRT